MSCHLKLLIKSVQNYIIAFISYQKIHKNLRPEVAFGSAGHGQPGQTTRVHQEAHVGQRQRPRRYEGPPRARPQAESEGRDAVGARNHWLDCLVGCAVAASVQGAVLFGTGSGHTDGRRRIRLSELRRQRSSSTTALRTV